MHQGVFNNRESFEDIPDVVRVGKFTRKDDEIILKNFDSIIEKMRKKKMKDEVLEDLFFKRHEHEMYFINILDHYLSQGLPDCQWMFSTGLKCYSVPSLESQSLRKKAKVFWIT